MNPQLYFSSTTQSANRETCIPSPSPFPTLATDHFPSPTSLPLDRDFRGASDPTQTNQGEEHLCTPPSLNTRMPLSKLRSVVDSKPRFILRQPPSCSHLTPRQSTRTMEFNISPPSLEDIMEELRREREEGIEHCKTTASVFESLLVPDDMIHLTESFFTPFGLRDSTQV